MTMIDSRRSTIQRPEPGYLVDDAQLAAAAFLARYSGRTLEAYRHDLRGFFQWAADNAIAVLEATRPAIELFRCWMEERGLAASTIDRRLSTVCGFYRFAHIDRRISSNPAQFVRRPCGSAKRTPPTSRTWAVSGATERCASWARASSPRPSRSCPARREPSTLPSASASRDRSCAVETGSASTRAPRTGGSGRSVSGLAWDRCIRTCSGPRSSWRPSTRVFRFAISSSPPDTPTRARHHLRPPTAELQPPRGLRRRGLRGRRLISAPSSSGTSTTRR
jgi:Phage integrase, N-terminal SAM-like domain